MRFSIVINTYNRAQSLAVTLRSLRYLREQDFEVVVVNGPSDDATEQVLASYGDSIRVGVCPQRNLSISRNIGIRMAHGEIVAFLDDDAVPDEYWLRDLAAGYDSAGIAGVGGVVYGHTGYRLQYTFSSSDRLGNARWDDIKPSLEECYPGSQRFPYLQGTNASFRRGVLIEIGGFDEEFDYYLDETDVCLRIIDAGYRLRQIAGGCVYHRFLPSSFRNDARVVTQWFPIIKNKVYFALKNAFPEVDFRAIMQDAERFISHSEEQVRHNTEQGSVGGEVLERFFADAPAALREGVMRGLTSQRRLLTGTSSSPVPQDASTGAFKLFPTLRPRDRLTVCLLSQEYPVAMHDGAGRFTRELASALAEAGHAVHVVTPSELPESTVDFESGIWIHRVAEEASAAAPPDRGANQPHLWRRSQPIAQELLRIHVRHPVDVVGAPASPEEFLAEAESIRSLLGDPGVPLAQLRERHEIEQRELLGQLEQVRAALHARDEQLRAREEETQQLSLRLAVANSQLSLAKARLRSLRESFSWKLTTPLREVHRGAKRLVRLVRGRSGDEISRVELALPGESATPPTDTTIGSSMEPLSERPDDAETALQPSAASSPMAVAADATTEPGAERLSEPARVVYRALRQTADRKQ